MIDISVAHKTAFFTVDEMQQGEPYVMSSEVGCPSGIYIKIDPHTMMVFTKGKDVPEVFESSKFRSDKWRFVSVAKVKVVIELGDPMLSFANAKPSQDHPPKQGPSDT